MKAWAKKDAGRRVSNKIEQIGYYVVRCFIDAVACL